MNITKNRSINFKYKQRTLSNLKDTLVNDFVLEHDWKQLYVVENTENYIDRDIQLQNLHVKLTETWSSTNYVPISSDFFKPKQIT